MSDICEMCGCTLWGEEQGEILCIECDKADGDENGHYIYDCNKGRIEK